jgi:hypothetical protein
MTTIEYYLPVKGNCEGSLLAIYIDDKIAPLAHRNLTKLSGSSATQIAILDADSE